MTTRTLALQAALMALLALLPAAAGARPAPRQTFKPGSYAGRTTQGLPVSFTANRDLALNFRIEVEMFCYGEAPPESDDLIVSAGSYKATYRKPRVRIVSGRGPSFFRFTETPAPGHYYASPMVRLRRTSAWADFTASKSEAGVKCEPWTRDPATGYPTSNGVSFKIRRR